MKLADSVVKCHLRVLYDRVCDTASQRGVKQKWIWLWHIKVFIIKSPDIYWVLILCNVHWVVVRVCSACPQKSWEVDWLRKWREKQAENDRAVSLSCCDSTISTFISCIYWALQISCWKISFQIIKLENSVKRTFPLSVLTHRVKYPGYGKTLWPLTGETEMTSPLQRHYVSFACLARGLLRGWPQQCLRK